MRRFGVRGKLMGGAMHKLAGLHRSAFDGVQKIADGWLLGLAARFVFASVLLVYFINSARTKLGEGFFGLLNPSDGAYAQILPAMMEQVGYDASQIPFFPYGLIVVAGTLGELLLPIMVTIGLFTRISSLGMIVFIIVMSYVDITGHYIDEASIGTLFDGNPGAIIADQRLMWIFVLFVLVLRGPGRVSVDWLIGRSIRQ